MKAKVTLLIFSLVASGSAYSDSRLEPSVSLHTTLGEIRGKIAAHERIAEDKYVAYRKELHAYIAGIQAGYKIAFNRHITKRNRVLLCTFLKPEVVLEAALEPSDENIGTKLSDFTWDFLLIECNDTSR